MTTLTEFKEIEAKATKGPLKADKNLGCKRISAKLYGDHKQAKRTEVAHTVGLPEEEDSANAKLFAISRSALPALIAVAEQMVDALRNSNLILLAEGIDDAGTVNQALAAYEAWAKKIEGE